MEVAKLQDITPQIAALRKETMPELLGTVVEFERIYARLPEAGNRIAEAYHNILKKYGVESGEVRVYWVGGRVRGQPLRTDSDIDIVITVENLEAAWANPYTTFLRVSGIVRRPDYEGYTYDEIFHEIRATLTGYNTNMRPEEKAKSKDSIPNICRELGIPNKFELHGLGDDFTKPGLRGPSLLIGVWHQP